MVTGSPADRQETAFRAGWPAAPATGLALALIAVVLRLWHVGEGLPDFLEEAIPFKQAFAMWGWDTGHVDLNPHFFHYPSLSLYLQFALQQLHYLFGRLAGTFGGPADYWLAFRIDPTPNVILGRCLGIACEAATVLAVWRIGERLRRGAGVLAALLVAMAGTMIATSRLIQADLPLTALSMWSLERMLAFQRDGGRSRFWTACILLGLAAGAKYTAGLLVLPLAWTLYARDGRRGLALWPAGVGVAVLAFLLSTPYALVDLHEFWNDFSYERRHMAEGHLGTIGRRGALFALATFVRDLGWPAAAALVAAGVRLLLRLRKRRPRGTGSARSAGGGAAAGPSGAELATVWLAFLPGALAVASFRMEAARYLLPLLPPAALLAAEGTLALAAPHRRAGRRWAAPLLCAVLLAWPVRHGLATAAAGSIDTRQQARAWLEANLGMDRLVVQESYGAEVRNQFDASRIERDPLFAAAGEAMRRRFAACPVLRSVILPMATSGSYAMTAALPDGRREDLTVYRHASDLNRIFYEPALYRGVDVVVTSGAVRRRYEESPERYPTQLAFYRLLDARADVVARFAPGDGVEGPAITVYALDGDCRDYLERTYPRLDPFWWADSVDREFRLRVGELLGGPGGPDPGAVRAPDGRPAQWVLNLRRPFTTYVVPFLMPMAQDFLELGRWNQGRAFSAAVLAMIPDEEAACGIFSRCAAQLGAWEDARESLTATIGLLEGEGREPAALRMELARVLERLGEPDAAREQLERIVATTPADHPVAQQARRLLSRADDGKVGGGG